MFLDKYLGFAINTLLQCLLLQPDTFCISNLGFSMQMLLSSQTWALPWSRGLRFKGTLSTAGHQPQVLLMGKSSVRLEHRMEVENPLWNLLREVLG